MPTTQNEDRTAILALEKAYDDAWNQGEAGKVASFFTHDAIIINPHGEVAEGKKEFENLLTQLFNDRFKDSTHRSTIIRVHFSKENVAVVDGEATVTEINELGEATKTIVRFTDVMVKQDEEWLIADTRAYIYLPTSQYASLARAREYLVNEMRKISDKRGSSLADVPTTFGKLVPE